MAESEIPCLSLSLEENCLARFFYLLQGGFRLKIRVGINVRATLTQEFGLDAGDLDKIQTVFLDGKAVDDLDSSVVREDSILALSAAMPGLVGATLRRGSYYATMRSQITAASAREADLPQMGMVTLKLFNLTMDDLGPLFLRRGILIQAAILESFLASQPGNFWKCCKKAHLDGNLVDPLAVGKIKWRDPDALVCLRVESNSDGGSCCLGGGS